MRIIAVGSRWWQDEESVRAPLIDLYRRTDHLQIVYRGRNVGVDRIIAAWITHVRDAGWSVEAEVWATIGGTDDATWDATMIASGVTCTACGVEGFVVAWPLGQQWQDTRRCMQLAEDHGLPLINLADPLTRRLRMSTMRPCADS